MDAPIRRLDVAELSDCIKLASSRQWSPEEHKWTLLFEVGEVYGLDSPGGGLAGVVVLTKHGTEYAGIGMMLVAKEYARQGIGTRLMECALREAGNATVWLTATEMGRPLYEKLGFQAISHSTQLIGDFTGRAGMISRPASTEDMAAILELDTEVFGAARTELLARLPAFTRYMRVVDGPNGIVGYGGAWQNLGTTVIGPLVAADSAMAQGLIADLVVAVGGPVRLDLDHKRPELLEWADESGLERGSTVSVMVFGAPLPGDRDRLFLPVTVAMG